jgi:pyridoxal phosphate enzyme (YggS family)
MTDIAGNLEVVRRKIATAARAAGRDPEAIKLAAVGKGHAAEAIATAIVAGQKLFGENRVQEAKAKYAGLREKHPGIELHLIGPLQTNKAEEAVRLFDVIETLDRPKLAEAFAVAIRKTARAPVFYIEVNIGAEKQKAGIAPQELGGFLAFCRKNCGLTVEGLMCIPPQDRNPAPFFRRLRELAAQHGLAQLSMGMSGDFETAVREGATEVRVGTGIFGERANSLR